MKKSGLKAFAVLCAAASMAAGTINTAGINYEPTSAITASAVEQAEITVSAKRYGLALPANKVIIRRGDITIKELDWNGFVKGYKFKSPVDTTAEVFYNDGTIIYNAYSGDIIRNTRKSGISREKFYISLESFKPYITDTLGISLSANPPFEFFVVSSEITEEGKPYVYDNPLKESAAENPEYFESTHSFDNGDLEFDYRDGTDIYIVLHCKNNFFTTILRYDVNKSEVSSTGYFNEKLTQNVNTVHLSADMFPAEKGYARAEVTTAWENNGAIFPQLTDGIVIDEDDNGKAEKVIYTEDDINAGTQVGWLYPSMSFGEMCNVFAYMQVKFFYENGDYRTYAIVGNGDAVCIDEMKTPVLTPYYTLDFILTVEAEKDGVPAVSNEILGLPEQDYNYSVLVFKGSEIIDTISKSAFEIGETVIKDYDPDSNYYLKVVAEDKENGIFYRYYPEFKSWIKRVDTSETPTVTAKINEIMFPSEYDTCKAYYRGVDLVTIGDAKDFGAGLESFTLKTTEGMEYEVVFDGERTYTYIGIDAEPVNAVPSEPLTKIQFTPYEPSDNQLSADDSVYTFEGVLEKTDDNGNPIEVKGDASPVISDGTTVVSLPDGTYKVTDNINGLSGIIVIDHDNSENRDNAVTGGTENNETPVITITPEEIFTVTVKTPDGTELFSGDVTDGAFDTKDDFAENTADDYAKYPYYRFETAQGTGNGREEDITRNKGYFTVSEDGTLEFIDVIKGDVNLDGKINIADVVMGQKYLLDNLADYSFGLENLIAFDVCEDGKCNVFDMIIERRIFADAYGFTSEPAAATTAVTTKKTTVTTTTAITETGKNSQTTSKTTTSTKNTAKTSTAVKTTSTTRTTTTKK